MQIAILIGISFLFFSLVLACIFYDRPRNKKKDNIKDNEGNDLLLS
jgi:hypothetical protein